MKYLQLFEDYKRDVFVGYMCTSSTITNYEGLISSDYEDRFEMILDNIKDKYKEAKKHLEDIKEQGISYGSDLAYEIANFFNEIGLRWIFVNEDKPLTRYGDICYAVYFSEIGDTFSIQDYNESGSDYSYMYFYYDNDNNKPILSLLSDSDYEDFD